MPKDYDNDLYHDSFFTVMSWLNSATLALAVGLAISVLAVIFVHWVLGAITFVVTLVIALASYLAFKK